MNERYAPRPQPHRPASNGASKAPREKMKLTPPRPKRWSHQDDLESLKGKMVCLDLVSGGKITGRLIEADQFALKVTISGHLAQTFFKHNISHYSETVE